MSTERQLKKMIPKIISFMYNNYVMVKKYIKKLIVVCKMCGLKNMYFQEICFSKYRFYTAFTIFVNLIFYYSVVKMGLHLVKMALWFV